MSCLWNDEVENEEGSDEVSMIHTLTLEHSISCCSCTICFSACSACRHSCWDSVLVGVQPIQMAVPPTAVPKFQAPVHSYLAFHSGFMGCFHMRDDMLAAQALPLFQLPHLIDLSHAWFTICCAKTAVCVFLPFLLLGQHVCACNQKPVPTCFNSSSCCCATAWLATTAASCCSFCCNLIMASLSTCSSFLRCDSTCCSRSSSSYNLDCS